MKRLLMAAVLLMCACTDPEIICWYTVSYTQQIGEPWLALRGRTHRFREDTGGPMFRTQEDLDKYLHSRNLKMCGEKEVTATDAGQ